MLPALDDFTMTQERSSFFDIPRSAIISQHLSLGESAWRVDKTKERVRKGKDIWFKKRCHRKTHSPIYRDLRKLNKSRYR